MSDKSIQWRTKVRIMQMSNRSVQPPDQFWRIEIAVANAKAAATTVSLLAQSDSQVPGAVLSWLGSQLHENLIIIEEHANPITSGGGDAAS